MSDVGGEETLQIAAPITLGAGDLTQRVTTARDDEAGQPAGASSTADIAGTTQQAAASLSKLAGDLTTLVGAFRF